MLEQAYGFAPFPYSPDIFITRLFESNGMTCSVSAARISEAFFLPFRFSSTEWYTYKQYEKPEPERVAASNKEKRGKYLEYSSLFVTSRLFSTSTVFRTP